MSAHTSSQNARSAQSPDELAEKNMPQIRARAARTRLSLGTTRTSTGRPFLRALFNAEGSHLEMKDGLGNA